MKVITVVFVLFVVSYGMASAQAVPVVGAYQPVAANGGQVCQGIGGSLTDVVSEVFMPFLSDGGDPIVGPFCPTVSIGADVLLDAESGGGALLFVPGSSSWYSLASAIAVTDTAVYSPSLTTEQIIDIFTSAGSGNAEIVGVWPAVFDSTYQADIPGGTQRQLGQRLLELDRRMANGELSSLIPVGPNTRIANVPVAEAAVSLYIVCPQAAGDTYYVKHEATFLSGAPTPKWLIEISHPEGQLRTVCPGILSYIYIPGDNYWNMMPARLQADVKAKVDKFTRVYSRNLRILPEVGAATAETAQVRWTVSLTAAGGAAIIYMSINRGGGMGALMITQHNFQN